MSARKALRSSPDEHKGRRLRSATRREIREELVADPKGARGLECRDKVRHVDRRSARAARRRRPDLDRLRVYRCGWCGGYHLGHQDAHRAALVNAELLELAEVDPLAVHRARLEALGLDDVDGGV